MNDTSVSPCLVQSTLQIWRQLLHADDLDSGDDLRMRGANSLMFMVAFMRANETFRTDAPLADLFATRTVREFAAAIQRAGGGNDPF